MDETVVALRQEDESLLAELDKLEVVEAKELQEGMTFHSFVFDG